MLHFSPSIDCGQRVSFILNQFITLVSKMVYLDVVVFFGWDLCAVDIGQVA